MHPFFVRNRLSAYLDGDLTDTEQAEMEAAIAENEDLQNELEELQLCQHLLQDLGQEEPSEAIFDNIMEAIDDEDQSAKIIPWPKIIQYTSLAAAALLAVILIADQNTNDAISPAHLQSASVISAPPTPNDIVLPIHEKKTILTPDEAAETSPGLAPISEPPPSLKTKQKSPSLSSKRKKRSRKEPRISKQTSRKNIQRRGNVVTFVVEDPEEVQKIRRIRINAKGDSQILYKISSLVQNNGGALFYSSGARFQAAVMDEDQNFQYLIIKNVPLTQLESIKQGIRQLGARVGKNYRISNDQTVEIKLGIYFNEPV